MERAGLAIQEHQHTIEAAPPNPRLQEYRTPLNDPKSAKRYARTKLGLGLVSSGLVLSLTLAFLSTGLAQQLEAFIRTALEHDYLVLLAFALTVGAAESLATLPLKFASGYLLEHKYGLSNQTTGRWILEGTKAASVGALLTVPVLFALFWSLRTFGELWWVPLGVLLFFLSVVLARLAPVLLFPLFHKFTPVGERALKDRVTEICEKVGMKISGVFVFDMSKNTKKANAAFAGIGKSRRVMLGDTLVANCTDEEIETIVAHELGHFRLGHLHIMIIAGTISTFVGLYLTSRLYAMSLAWFGFSAGDSVAALPLLGLWLALYSFVTSPFTNLLSRAHERAADRFAVRLTGKKEAFRNALTKLATLNLADTSPHPAVEFLFHSHPSIARRIKLVEKMQIP